MNIATGRNILYVVYILCRSCYGPYSVATRVGLKLAGRLRVLRSLQDWWLDHRGSIGIHLCQLPNGLTWETHRHFTSFSVFSRSLSRAQASESLIIPVQDRRNKDGQGWSKRYFLFCSGHVHFAQLFYKQNNKSNKRRKADSGGEVRIPTGSGFFLFLVDFYWHCF